MNTPLFVAEIAAAHNGSLSRALEIVDAAAEAGANAVKIQTFLPEFMSVDKRQLTSGPWVGKTLPELYAEAHTLWDWHGDIFHRCKQKGMFGMSTPFHVEAVDFLESLDVPCYKIASFELTDIPLIEYVASKGRPIFLSTGMASPDEIFDALTAARKNGKENMILKCVSAYPANPADYNLSAIPVLRSSFQCDVGLSDHTIGHMAAVVATALGATVIEKHLTLRRADGGPDAGFSSEPDEFARMVRECKEAAAACGDPTMGPTAAEGEYLHFRRGLWAVKDIKAGEIVTRKNVRSMRPAGELLPIHFQAIENKRINVDVPSGTSIKWGMFDNK